MTVKWKVSMQPTLKPNALVEIWLMMTTLTGKKDRIAKAHIYSSIEEITKEILNYNSEHKIKKDLFLVHWILRKRLSSMPRKESNSSRLNLRRKVVIWFKTHRSKKSTRWWLRCSKSRWSASIRAKTIYSPPTFHKKMPSGKNKRTSSKLETLWR